ncbi:MAG: TrkA family potassium uptake protein [Cyanobacteria bacterium P01_G01_bin.19]
MKSLYIVVIGCGRLGSILAGDLSQQGHEVVVIDRDKSAFARLGGEFSGFTVAGNAAEIKTLQKASLNKARVAIAVTGNDNLNIMMSQLAKTTFDIPIVLTRIQESARAEIYRQLGLTIIDTTQVSATACLQTLHEQLIDMS